MTCAMRKDFVISNIPFVLRQNPDAFLTSFQKDFQACRCDKVAAVEKPTPAQVDHKDLRLIKEYGTEAMVSYKRHPLEKITRIPRWSKLLTNFKMPTDLKETTFLSTVSEMFRPKASHTPPASFRPTSSTILRCQQMEKTPESIHQTSFPPHHVTPPVKSSPKHNRGFPAIKHDKCDHISHYNGTFKGVWTKPAQPVSKHSSSVTIGDPQKIVECETTHASSFSQPSRCSPRVAKQRLKLHFGDYMDECSSTSRDTFCPHTLEVPVQRIKKNLNLSSVPEGDTDEGRNRARMSATTTRAAFPHPNPTESPLFVTGSDLMTKSNVQFSPAQQTEYLTTAAQYFCKKKGERPRLILQAESNILKEQVDQGANLSTCMADYLPWKVCKQNSRAHEKSHISFPQDHEHFSTTHRDSYNTKPLMVERPSVSQFTSHFVVQ